MVACSFFEEFKLVMYVWEEVIASVFDLKRAIVKQLLLASEVYNLEPWVFVPIDQRSGNERPWKVLIGSPKISDFPLNCACLAFKNVTQRTSWCFTSGHFYCFQNQSKSILQRNFRDSLVSSSLRSQERRLEVRDC